MGKRPSYQTAPADNSHYHYTDHIGSRIAEKFVLFISEMQNKKIKDEMTIQALRRHVIWKRQAHFIYRELCRDYIIQRRRWKWQMIKKALKRDDILWPLFMNKKNIAATANSRRMHLSVDCRSLAKKEVFQQRDRSQDSDITEFAEKSESE